MKKLSSIIALAFCVLAISATAFAATLIGPDQARTIAQKHVPTTSTVVRIENEFNKFAPYYEVKFYDSTTHTEYEVDVLQDSGAVRKFSMEAKALFGSSNIVLSTNDIQNLVLKEYPDARINRIHLDRDDYIYEYDVHFSTPNLRGEITYNPETGAVLEKELRYFR